MNRPLRLAECSQPISWVFCVYFVGGRCIIATRQQCCCNPFRMHSRNIRNVFVICVLHIRRVKVWFLRCKSMVFGVQKGGFCRARNRFLHCKSMVFVFWMLCCCNLFRMLSQSVRSEMAICQQHFGKPSAAVGVRFIVPAYMKTPTKWRTEMCVRWNEYTYLIM